MQTLLELLPLVAFFVTYSMAGIYVATAVLMGAMALLLVADYIRERRIPAMHAVSAVLVFAFGAATLILHDQRFIQWKPTIFSWMLALAFLGSMWIGKQTLTQRLLGRALEGQVVVSDGAWRTLNLLSVVFYAVLGAANILVAFNASEATWVKFKVFGVTVAIFVFTAAQLVWLMKRPAAPSSAQT